MSIGSILVGRGPVVSATSAHTIRQIIGLLHEHRIGAVLVIDDQVIGGIVSERDIVGALHRIGHAVLDSPVPAVMSTPVVTATPEWSIAEAMAIMTNRRIRHLPVVVAGTLVGIVSIGDLVKRRIEEAEDEAMALKEYITAS